MHKVDFHLHTTASDGILSPKEIVKRASEKEVTHMAITDHDTVDGIEEALNEAKKRNIKLIPGIEFSTYHNGESIHILGYFKDDKYKSKEFKNYISNLKEMRIKRAKKIVENLDKYYNIKIDFYKLLEKSKGVVARPHIANEIINEGYPYTFDYIFENFLSNDSKAFVPTNKISTKEGVEFLKSFGCKVFLAHPKLIKKSPLTDFLNINLDGMECIYFLNSEEEEKKLKKFAKENNLITSCGSDCHGNFKTDKKHGDVGDMKMTDEEFKNFISLF